MVVHDFVASNFALMLSFSNELNTASADGYSRGKGVPGYLSTTSAQASFLSGVDCRLIEVATGLVLVS
jgi:TPP-dependent 2-oxoacid decarboxylase